MILVVCPSWGKACGIAEYTKSLVAALLEMSVITTRLSPVEGFRLVHLQHEYGLYTSDELREWIRRCEQAGVPLVITMHTACHHAQNDILRTQQIIVHHEVFVSLLGFPQMTVIPIGCGPSISPDPPMLIEARKRLGLTGAYPVIGSFGFLRMQKGYVELVAAAKRLQAFFPKIKVLLVAPKHGFGEYYETTFQAILQRFDLVSLVVLARSWTMEETDIVKTLQCADLLVLNYIASPIGGGLSAAARTCLRTQRPVMVTDSLHFADLNYEVYKYPDPSIETLVTEIPALLQDAEQIQRLRQAARTFVAQRAWPYIGQLHLSLYQRMEARCESLLPA